jgi:TatD DNase family protein
MTFADSHCHLDAAEFDADREAVVERARAAGVGMILAIGTATTPDTAAGALVLAGRYEGVWASAGVQPHDAHLAPPETFGRLEELAGHPRIAAVGETGLEYHYDVAPRATQRDAFIRQIHIAGRAGKPVVIHTREAWPDTFAILEEHWSPYGLPGIMHCFTGGPGEADRSLAIGFYLSFSGILTFRSAGAIREAARMAPLDRLLVETDAPLLAPAPGRGRRNEPAFVVETVRKLAEVRGQDLAEIAAATSQNLERLCLRTVNASEYTG